MYADLNELNFFKLFKLTDITNSVFEIGRENKIEDADIIVFSALLCYLGNKTKNELSKVLSDVFLFSRSEIKKIFNDEDDYSVAVMKLFAKNYYKKYSNTRLSGMLDINCRDISSKFNLEYSKFILSFLNDTYSNLHDDDLTEMFVSRLDAYQYTEAVRVYFLVLALERFYLIEDFNVIQYEKCKNNFIYALNSEIILSINLLIRYGKNKRIDLLSEETMELCNNAIEETVINSIQNQQFYITRNHELETKIKNLELEIQSLNDTIMSLQNKINQKEISSLLEGKNILVIGDEGRKEGYKEIIEKYGAIFDFLPGIGIKSTTAVRRSEANDIVFYMTGYAKHEVYDSIKHLDNIYYIHNTGLGSLETKILSIINFNKESV